MGNKHDMLIETKFFPSELQSRDYTPKVIWKGLNWPKRELMYISHAMKHADIRLMTFVSRLAYTNRIGETNFHIQTKIINHSKAPDSSSLRISIT